MNYKLLSAIIVLGLLCIGGLVIFNHNSQTTKQTDNQINIPDFMKNGEWKKIVFNEDVEGVLN